jgi:transcriptional regulator with XRE-family HTH domain
MSNIPDYLHTYSAADVGKRIAKLREKAGLSMYQLQMNSDVNRTIIKQTEDGTNKVRIDTLLKILNGLGISPAEFFAAFK